MKYDYNFDNRKKKNKIKVIYIIVIMLIVIVISSFILKDTNIPVISNISNGIITPFKYISNFTSDTFKNVTSNFSKVSKVNKELEEMKLKNDELELKLIEQQRIIFENNSLKEMLKISNTFQHFKLKHGRIVIREHDNYSQTFIIDIGSKDGIKQNQTVIHNQGLVGYISKVNESTSVVTTILDPKTSVSVTISTINEPAILKGNLELKNKNNLKLEYIPIDSELSIGDMLYSSGLGSMFPNAIPVGRVVEIISKKNDSDRFAIVEPTVNIKAISEVSVITE